MPRYFRGQSPTGNLAFVLALAALACWVLTGFVGVGTGLFLAVGCAGATLLAFIVGAYAHQEGNGRLDSARAALITATGLLVYYAVTRVF
jgi:hypothetical protein